jgi:hypothetical protein
VVLDALDVLAHVGRGVRTPVRKALLAAAVTRETYGRGFGPKCRFFWQHLAADWQRNQCRIVTDSLILGLQRLRSTRGELAELDRYCAEMNLSRSQVVRRA